LGNLVKAKLTLVFRNSLKIDGLKFDLLEENFPPDIHRDPKSKIDHYLDSENYLLLKKQENEHYRIAGKLERTKGETETKICVVDGQ
jgi:hypothetical protein